MVRHYYAGADEALGYRHEALLYSGDAGFVDATAPFIQGGLEAGEPVLVAVRQHQIALLRDALGTDADFVQFIDMAELGRNPARIIPAWREFLDARPRAYRVRGIGEPIWSGRSRCELVECQRHESLLNLAVAEREPFWLLCPYDVELLGSDVIDEVFRSHPYISGGDGPHGQVRGRDGHAAAFLATPLPSPPPRARSMRFTAAGLREVRAESRAFGEAGGIGLDRLDDFELAVGEVVANSVLHGGGQGLVTLWSEGSQVVCEVQDTGRIIDPLVGRRSPDDNGVTGRGLWLVNQLCDLVQIRVFAEGTTIRLHVERNHSNTT